MNAMQILGALILLAVFAGVFVVARIALGRWLDAVGVFAVAFGLCGLIAVGCYLLKASS
jgi:hypothetical protein